MSLSGNSLLQPRKECSPSSPQLSQKHQNSSAHWNAAPLGLHVIYFCLQNPSRSVDLEEEGTIWVTLRVTWFQAKVSEKNMQKPLTFQLLLVGTHFTKGIWQLFKIIKKKNKPQKRPKTRISERYLCMLSLVVGSFLYTQLDTLRMIRIPMVTTSTCVLHPFHWGIKTLQVSHSGRFPRMMLSDYHASF